MVSYQRFERLPSSQQRADALNVCIGELAAKVLPVLPRADTTGESTVSGQRLGAPGNLRVNAVTFGKSPCHVLRSVLCAFLFLGLALGFLLLPSAFCDCGVP